MNCPISVVVVLVDQYVPKLYLFAQKTPNRVPVTDWYIVDNAQQRGFQARSVVGGFYIKMLENKILWKKWAGN